MDSPFSADYPKWGGPSDDKLCDTSSVIKHIHKVLMEEEEGMEPNPCMILDPLVLQTTEKSFYDIIIGGGQNPLCVDDHSEYRNDSNELLMGSTTICGSIVVSDNGNSEIHATGQLVTADEGPKRYNAAHRDVVAAAQKSGSEHFHVGLSGNKGHQKEKIGFEDGKQSAVYVECDLSDSLGKALIDNAVETKEDQNGMQYDVQVSRMACGKKRSNKKEVKDLRRLLIMCAEAIAADDRVAARQLLNQIRQHSSLLGDYYQRLAHCFANALEACLAGTGTQLYTTSLSSVTKQVSSAADVSKFYRTYIAGCPFMKMLMIFANDMILKAAEKAETLHIIDFGIRQGFQWPALIHCLSKRPGGPPKLRITGLELDSSGSQPEDTVEETGRRLASYCKRFHVPFEYYAITKKWETLQFDDLKVHRNEVLAVNCICRFKYLLDETVMVNSPRDTVLNLIKKLNPDVFVQSIVNASHCSSFVSRFREALSHFSTLFDMWDTTFSPGDQMRLRFEKDFIGRDVLNIVACEGADRIVRPETYKQWQIRNIRTGFRQLPLDNEVVKKIKEKVKMEYHPDFSVTRDGQWMLLGWKAKIMFGAACWEPSRT